MDSIFLSPYLTIIGYTTSVNLARLGSSFKNQPDGFTNFFAEHQQQHQQRHISVLSLVLFLELTIACG